MPRSKGKHLTKEDREVIEDGIRSGRSARSIAKRVDVSPSTVTREVRAHRTVRDTRFPKGGSGASRCARYRECQRGGDACPECSSRLTTCKRCATRRCVLTCPDYERRMCPETGRWPYVCPEGCAKRAHCGYPKCSYDAGDADAAYRETLSSSRSGICATEAELEAMNAIVVPLARKGQSFEAIWATHGGELPVCVRTAYRYQELGAVGLTSVDMPRKARLLPRKRPEPGPKRPRVDRSGREHDDFLALPADDRCRVVMGDSVVGFSWNESDILTLHVAARSFQLYLKKAHGDAAATVARLDEIERSLGSPAAFRGIFGVLLVDRGVEFDDWAGMERSCLEPGESRCRVFYCDPMESNQKSPAERNHGQLRRILPKGRSDFDRLSEADVAECCANVNSYPLAGRDGKCAFDLVEGLVPRKLLDDLGIVRVPPDEVVLKPYLMAHAVDQ